MNTHFHRDLEYLRTEVLAIGGMVEKAVGDATDAVIRRDRQRATRVIAGDGLIDRAETRLDDDCLKVMALHQPVATDLRFITVVMKINSDLERIGDMAKNLGEHALALCDLEPLEESLQIESMTEAAREMLQGALNALVHLDTEQARAVLGRDDEVDDMDARNHEVLMRRMMEDPASVPTAMSLVGVSHDLERIADLATNIAEDVVFLVEAVDIRHTVSQGKPERGAT